MKTTKKLLILIFSFGMIFSCSKNDSNSEDLEIVKESELTRYENIPNVENQLLAETYIKDDDAKTFIYGSADADGNILSVESLAFKETNSDEVFYFILDYFQRVTQIYSETNGVKNAEVQYFYYPEPGLVNYVVAERNWVTQEDTILHFSSVETDGVDFIAHNLYGKAGQTKLEDPIYGFLLAHIAKIAGVLAVVAVAAVGSTISATAGVVGGLIAALTFAGAAIANETPVANMNPNAPSPPEITVTDNQCTNSNLSVIIGVDPGNELYAIVNEGDSTFYDFYWSTGEEDTDVITSHITAPDDGTYYVMVKDEKGCVAFGSSSSESAYKDLIIGTWKETGYTTNGVDEFDSSDCDLIATLTQTQIIETEYYGDNPGECNKSDTSISSYSIVGNVITETVDGETNTAEILELNETVLVIKETELNYIFIQTLSRQ